MGYFSENYSALRFSIGTGEISGLRNAQLGAIHAIAAHDSLHKQKAGIVVMPTGSGKTCVLMMAPYIALSCKALVVTPSVMVRGQIYEDYVEMKTLKHTNVFPIDTLPPSVYELKNKYSEDMRENIQSADVIIATPQCALSLSESDCSDQFDIVLIDEAHHVPAPTWQQILINMHKAKHYLFTATPFRLDKKEIKGDIIYFYPLSMAYRDGIFGEIQYIPIDEAPDKDKLIAKEAERIFLNDRQQGYDHYLMVRTDTRGKAKELERLYQEETDLKLRRIDSSMQFKIIKACIGELKSRDIDGIICVDMLGEGFDFPNLKVAAVHTPHKSLASTLQFIGRFARTNAENIGAAKFIAMNDEELVIENIRLFTNDAIWQEIIIDLNERPVRREAETKKSLEEYVRESASVATEDTISLHSMRPNCHAKVYHISGFDIHGAFPEVCCVGDRVYRSKADNTVIGIGMQYSRPRWLETDQVMDIENMLFIVHYQVETSLLFIYSQMKTEIDYDVIAEAFTLDYHKVPRGEMHRVLWGLRSYEMFNTGMQNRFAENGESYRIMSGSNVASSIDAATGRMYSAGHVFCKAVSDASGELTIGYSSGSKIWSSSYLFIPEYVRWCDENGRKIANDRLVVKTNTNYDFVPIPRRLSEYPEKVFFAFFAEKTYSSPPSWIDPNGKLTDFVLTDASIQLGEIRKCEVALSVNIDGITDTFTLDLEGKYHCAKSSIALKDGRDRLSLVDYLNIHPLVLKTTDDAVIEGNEICEGAPDSVVFVPDDVYEIDWTAHQTDTRRETGNMKNGKRSIQSTLLELLKENPDFTYLIYDHGTGEIADFITITENDSTIEATLYHVKAMHGRNYNSDLNDIYEVTQQAIKSTTWLKSKSVLFSKIRSRRRSGRCELKKGKYNDLEKTLKLNKFFTARIVIVQPAISKNSIFPDKFQEVLAATGFYIRNSGRVTTLEIWGSP